MTQNRKPLPDIISDSSEHRIAALDWVGMEKIAIPIQFPVSHESQVSLNAFADIYVSLDKAVKGIHMSRLYLKLNNMLANRPMDIHILNEVLEEMLHSQDGVSNNARIKLAFELPLLKGALLSEHTGYQAYPIVIDHQLIAGKYQTQLEITIPYSSTCPCSASLAKQLIAHQIEEKFHDEDISKEGLVTWLLNKDTKLATPHNQRSYAYLALTLKENNWPDIASLIGELEDAIGTPVQTAVKRQDEQAFAQLNGKNLMFCEDAARKLDDYLTQLKSIEHFCFKVEHQESLHAHNAVVIHQKRGGIK